MLDAIRQWAMSACLATVACEIFAMISPSRKMERSFQITLTLFFLVCFLSPVVTHFGDFTLTIEPQSEVHVQQGQSYQEAYNRQVGTLFQSSVEQKIRGVLKKNGVTPEKVELNINTAEETSISIEQITLLLKDDDRTKTARIEEWIYKDFGVVPILRFASQGG